MKKIATFLFLCATLLLSFYIHADDQFGYVSYSTTNIGDDIQALAAKRFLPKNALPIDREYMHYFTHHTPVKTIVNGWFMHSKSSWYRDGSPPEISWPPSSWIKPFFISIHLNVNSWPLIFSENNIEYLRQHAPIGARDYFTLNALQKRNIPSYFSGCLTLTFEKSNEKRNNIIYAVDVDDSVFKYIQSHTNSKVVKLSHGIFIQLSNDQRLNYAEKLLDKYRKAKCVVTSRLHACMPCLAFDTPVLLIADSVDERHDRFHGLGELAWHCSEEQLLHGEMNYDFDNPSENPKTYIPIRENLIQTIETWVNTNRSSQKN